MSNYKLIVHNFIYKFFFGESMKILQTFIVFIYSSFLFCDVYEGYMLYTPGGGGASNTTYYKHWNGNTINTWSHDTGPASMPYLLPHPDGGVENSLLYYPCRSTNPTMESGGVGGRVDIYNWDGDLLYRYNISSTLHQHHHDIAVLPNGNFIVVAWERLYSSEWQALGRTSVNNNLNQMWATAFFEIQPTLDGRTESIENFDAVVWEWHFTDHVVQDVDSQLDNYGVISEHPELFDVNCGTVGSNGGPGGQVNGDWIHVNALDYNADLDQLVFSSRHVGEIFIIDHSTTTEEAASHSGGNSGKGGDFLYRWGGPGNYDTGNNSNNVLDSQHGVNWIPDGYPGEGNLILFNNYHSGNNAAVLEITTPLLEDGSYEYTAGEPYGPSTYIYVYGNNISSNMQSGAFRLPNGNTFITEAEDSEIKEVTEFGELVYSYEYPSNNVMIARAMKYAPEFFDAQNALGDVNGDDSIDILDVVISVNIVLGTENYTSSADMNGDGIVNVLDVIQLINIILVP